MPTLAMQITVTHVASGTVVHTQGFTIPGITSQRASQIRAIADKAIDEAQRQAGAEGARAGTLFNLRFQGQFNSVSVEDTTVNNVKMHRLGLIPLLLSAVWEALLG